MRRPFWLRNWADTDEAGADPGPLELSIPVLETLSRVEHVLGSLSHWDVVSVDPPNGIITATRRTRTFRFVDDVVVRLEPTDRGTLVRARSASRVGVIDLGQNRRNLRELFAALADPPLR